MRTGAIGSPIKAHDEARPGVFARRATKSGEPWRPFPSGCCENGFALRCKSSPGSRLAFAFAPRAKPFSARNACAEKCEQALVRAEADAGRGFLDVGRRGDGRHQRAWTSGRAHGRARRGHEEIARIGRHRFALALDRRPFAAPVVVTDVRPDALDHVALRGHWM